MNAHEHHHNVVIMSGENSFLSCQKENIVDKMDAASVVDGKFAEFIYFFRLQ